MTIKEAINQAVIMLKNENIDAPKNKARMLLEATLKKSKEYLIIYDNKEITPKERDELITRETEAVFIIGIGDKLKSGVIHDKRSPDYDDWSLDGDLLVYDKIRGKSVELTSMGIRVDKESLLDQLQKSDVSSRISFPYHQKIIHDQLPYTIGGGIGETRIVMLILGSSHIAEVQASTWPSYVYQEITDLSIL